VTPRQEGGDARHRQSGGRDKGTIMLHRYAMLAGLVVCVGTLWSESLEADDMESAGKAAGRGEIRIRSFLPDRPICRAKRPAAVVAIIENAGTAEANVQPKLILPDGVRLLAPEADTTVRIEGEGDAKVSWPIEADDAAERTLQLQVDGNGAKAATVSLSIRFLPAVEMRKLPYIPEPEPVRTKVLVGAHHCPLWESDKPGMWRQILKHPERTPALGFYSQENPEVSDWETKWAVEHGISFFIYCWYRASQGEPVTMRFGSAIHDALFKSRFVDKMKFTIMWENQRRGIAGVADEKDLMTNLMPFWIENYFKHPSYLKIDNKPVLFIYRPAFLIQDLGGVQNVVKAFGKMRQACRDAGFAGLYLLGEYRGLDPKHLTLMKRLGLDYTFAYCWHIRNNPTPEQAIRKQMENIRKTQELNILPQVVTVSQAWSGWRDEGSIWKIPPTEYEILLRQAKDFIATLPPDQLGHRMLVLDNWNEWGEGHYIAPYREYGFGYVDAVRKVFAEDAPEPHVDLIPEDIGMGPYDTAIQSLLQRDAKLRKLAAKVARKGDAIDDGLIAWWAFDEAADSPVALDYSGNRLGGVVHDAERTKGIDGSALVCKGGSILVPNKARLTPKDALTVECWVKTDTADQGSKWFLNSVFGKGTSGYRMGVMKGRPSFQVPQTAWSHHLAANKPLPAGRWVHLAGTFDGKTMRIYIDGEECGAMDRPGPIHPTEFPLCLGNYSQNHAAHFTGLLDEAKLYDRALTAEEVRKHCRKLGAP